MQVVLLEIKTKSIIEETAKEFNAMPFEERKRIGKYLTYQQILTLYQLLKKDTSLTTEAWRKKQREWLKNCVDSFLREYCSSDDKTGKNPV